MCLAQTRDVTSDIGNLLKKQNL